MNFTIRKAAGKDLENILSIYEKARQFQREHGNPSQWEGGYPQPEIVQKDLEAGELYAVCRQTPAGEELAGVFMFARRPEPNYACIREGTWLEEGPYAVLHRVASAGTCPGVGQACMDWAWEQCQNLRIDTHRDNYVMQRLLEKNGFVRCGLIDLGEGGERIAYQKCRTVPGTLQKNMEKPRQE